MLICVSSVIWDEWHVCIDWRPVWSCHLQLYHYRHQPSAGVVPKTVEKVGCRFFSHYYCVIPSSPSPCGSLIHAETRLQTWRKYSSMFDGSSQQQHSSAAIVAAVLHHMINVHCKHWATCSVSFWWIVTHYILVYKPRLFDNISILHHAWREIWFMTSAYTQGTSLDF